MPLRLLYRRLPALNPGRPAVVGVLVAGNAPGSGSVASPDGSVVGNQNNMGMNGGYGGGYGRGMRGPRGGYDGIELKTSVQLSEK